MIISGLIAAFSELNCGATSIMNCRTQLGQRNPFPSLSQQLKMALAVVCAILHSDDFLLFCINSIITEQILYSTAQKVILQVFSDLSLIQLQQVMSKSVRSYGSSSGRAKESQESGNNIKEKIKEILYSIKEERQHIENRLFENDVEINRLRKDYELLRYEHDFEHLNQEEEIFVEELREGLREHNINPQQIMGGSREQSKQSRELTKQEVIDVQQVLINQLKQLLKQ